ncbi:MAG: trigger factor [Desulfomonilaceae bacterium]
MTNIQVEDLSAVRKKVIFEIPQERVIETLEAQYRDLKKNAQIKGFRKGKVPLEILKNLFKDQVLSDTAKKIIEDTFEIGLDEKKIKPITVVNFDPQPLDPEKPFVYTVEIEAPPELDVQGFKGLSLNKIVHDVTDTDIDERIEMIRQRNSRLVPINENRGVQIEDHLVVDIEAVAEGETIKPLSVKDYHLEMGRNFYLPDFDSRLIGLKPGETATISYTLAEDFPRKEMAGKPAVFTVTIKEAKERVVPELNDELAKDLGEFESLEDLRKKVTQELRDSFDSDIKENVRKQIVEKIIEANPFEAPESLVESQIDSIIMSARQNLALQGIDMKRFPMPDKAQRDSIRPRAEQQVKAALILKAISEKEQILVSPEDIDGEIEKKAQFFGWSPDFFRDQLEEKQRMEDFTSSILEDKIYLFIEQQANVTEVPYSAEKNEMNIKESE